jgi:hypothetical protein
MRSSCIPAWRIEWFARELIDADTEGWYEVFSQYHAAMNAFEDSVRRDLRVPGPRSWDERLIRAPLPTSGQEGSREGAEPA